ncbi:hypothetical protein ACM0P6_00720 [Komagataeibacter sucrofermentans]|uniref:Uncharacterized protein n=1 Tax=Komagataeibacter sucrofermentans TaxID=1053551 RepID=A0A318QLL2_9PROT|nr:hypothetical protein [Komagataeibacter sucrofermentans]PYD80406.1 hypothetical protein CFR77_03125 [Komagataeibacter sucrofermentans]GBQ47137.1 hypothetical protein AA15973_1111 [Komagataeibacter sucrofermentans DSM 15973]
MAAGSNPATVLRALNERLTCLFNRKHQIGHAYCMGCKSRAAIDRILRHRIISLLAEYFYENPGKVTKKMPPLKGGIQKLLLFSGHFSKTVR